MKRKRRENPEDEDIPPSKRHKNTNKDDCLFEQMTIEELEKKRRELMSLFNNEDRIEVLKEFSRKLNIIDEYLSDMEDSEINRDLSNNRESHFYESQEKRYQLEREDEKIARKLIEDMKLEEERKRREEEEKSRKLIEQIERQEEKRRKEMEKENRKAAKNFQKEFDPNVVIISSSSSEEEGDDDDENERKNRFVDLNVKKEHHHEDSPIFIKKEDPQKNVIVVSPEVEKRSSSSNSSIQSPPLFTTCSIDEEKIPKKEQEISKKRKKTSSSSSSSSSRAFFDLTLDSSSSDEEEIQPKQEEEKEEEKIEVVKEEEEEKRKRKKMNPIHKFPLFQNKKFENEEKKEEEEDKDDEEDEKVPKKRKRKKKKEKEKKKQQPDDFADYFGSGSESSSSSSESEEEKEEEETSSGEEVEFVRAEQHHVTSSVRKPSFDSLERSPYHQIRVPPPPSYSSSRIFQQRQHQQQHQQKQRQKQKPKIIFGRIPQRQMYSSSSNLLTPFQLQQQQRSQQRRERRQEQEERAFGELSLKERIERIYNIRNKNASAQELLKNVEEQQKRMKERNLQQQRIEQQRKLQQFLKRKQLQNQQLILQQRGQQQKMNNDPFRSQNFNRSAPINRFNSFVKFPTKSSSMNQPFPFMASKLHHVRQYQQQQQQQQQPQSQFMSSSFTPSSSSSSSSLSSNGNPYFQSLQQQRMQQQQRERERQQHNYHFIASKLQQQTKEIPIRSHNDVRFNFNSTSAFNRTTNSTTTTSISSTEDLDQLLQCRDPYLERMKTPKRMKVKLYPHQECALHFLYRKEKRGGGGILSDDMGLGKTIEMIALMVKNPLKRTLIVAPLALLRQWKREIMTKCKDGSSWNPYIYHGPSRRKSAAFLSEQRVVLTTYGIVGTEFKEYKAKKSKKKREEEQQLLLLPPKKPENGPLFKVKWKRVILDEAHYIKNPDTRASQSCSALKGKKRWCLTGTPIQNRFDDLWSLFRFLRYSPYDDRRNFLELTKLVDANSMKKWKRIRKDIILRRRKMEKLFGKPIISLPKRHNHMIQLDFFPDELEIYQNMQQKAEIKFNRMYEEGSVMKNYASVLAMLLRLRQLCDHPFLVQRLGKKTIEKLYSSVNDDDDDDEDEESEDEEYVPGKFEFRNKRTNIVIDLQQKEEEEEEEEETEERTCPICCDSIVDPICTYCVNSPPNHWYCHECLYENCVVNKQQTCPVCRRKMKRSIIEELEQKHQQKTQKEKEKEAKMKKRMKGLEPSSKTKTLMGELTKVLNEHPTDKVLIMSQWTSFLDLLHVPLMRIVLQNGGKVKFDRLDGTMSMKRRDEVIECLNNTLPGSVRVILVSLRACGVGLNLNAANHVFFMDPWWNPAVEEQAIDRVYRLGQQKEVHVYRMQIRSSIEDRIQEIKENKKKIADVALGDLSKKSSANRLSLDDLAYLFTGKRKTISMKNL